jgi:hypothetical protein
MQDRHQKAFDRELKKLLLSVDMDDSGNCFLMDDDIACYKAKTTSDMAENGRVVENFIFTVKGHDEIKDTLVDKLVTTSFSKLNAPTKHDTYLDFSASNNMDLFVSINSIEQINKIEYIVLKKHYIDLS